jgi:long-chain acyl-CoA synthetase
MKTHRFNTNQSIYQAWSSANQSHATISAIEYFGNSISYAEMEVEIDRYARAFKALGDIERGSADELGKTVGFCVPTLPSTILGFFALNKIGVTACFISKELLKFGGYQQFVDSNTETLVVFDQFYPEIAKSLAKTNVKNVIIVSLSDDCPIIPEGIPDRLRFALSMNGADAIKKSVGSDTYYSLAAFLELGDCDNQAIESYYDNSGEKTAVILYTGGSTGVPKGVEKRDREFIAMANRHESLDNLDMIAGTRNGIFIPPNHPTGFVQSILLPMFYGATQVLQPIYNKETFVSDISRLKLDLAVAAPSHYATFLHNNLPDNALSHYKYPFSGGECVTPELAQSINKELIRLGVKYPLIISYGLSEVGPAAIFTVGDTALGNKSGKPLPGVKARIVDQEGNELGDNQRGLLEIYAPETHMKGYRNMPELTKDLWTKDGYAKTDDIAIRDENGDYEVFGRATDCFTDASGKSHYLFDIENFIYKDDRVAEAESVALTVGKQEYPVAFIVLKQNTTDAPSEIIKRIYASAHRSLPPQEVPMGMMMLDKFETNAVSTKRDYASLKLIREGYYYADEEGTLFEVEFTADGIRRKS